MLSIDRAFYVNVPLGAALATLEGAHARSIPPEAGRRTRFSAELSWQ